MPKLYTEEDLKKLLEKERRNFQTQFSEEYNSYIDNGGAFLKTFNMKVDVESLATPSPNVFNWVHDKGVNTFALIIGILGAYVGYKLTETVLKDLAKKIGGMIKSMESSSQLGIVLIVLGVFVVSLRTYTNMGKTEQTKNLVKQQLSRIGKTGEVANSIADELINAARLSEFSLINFLRKIVYSILSVFDLAVQSFKTAFDLLKSDIATQMGVVMLVIGIIMLATGLKSGKSVTELQGAST